MITEPGQSNATRTATDDRYDRLLASLRDLGSAVVAFSGGVDSTLLLHAAREALGDRVVAASGLSETYAEEEMADARRLAALVGVPYEVVPTMELTDPRYANNSHQRCYFCKSELYTRLDTVRDRLGFAGDRRRRQRRRPSRLSGPAPGPRPSWGCVRHCRRLG